MAFNIVNFDGTNDFLSKTSITGLSDGKSGLIGARFKVAAAGEGSFRHIFQIYDTGAGDRRFYLYLLSDNTPAIAGFNSSNTQILQLVSSTAILNATGTVTVLGSWDLAAATAAFYIDSAAQTVGTLTNDNIDYATTKNYYIGADVGAASYNGDVEFVYFTTPASYLDITVSGNRDKFLSTNIGSDGSGPTGTQALVYYTGLASVWNAGTNSGSGGNYTMTGAVTDVGGGGGTLMGQAVF